MKKRYKLGCSKLNPVQSSRPKMTTVQVLGIYAESNWKAQPLQNRADGCVQRIENDLCHGLQFAANLISNEKWCQKVCHWVITTTLIQSSFNRVTSRPSDLAEYTNVYCCWFSIIFKLSNFYHLHYHFVTHTHISFIDFQPLVFSPLTCWVHQHAIFLQGQSPLAKQSFLNG